MVGFWISAGAMVVMVAVVLLQALRQAKAAGPGGVEDLAIYRDQLSEVDRDLARGVIPADEAGRLRTEVQRRMLEADRMVAQGSAALAPRRPVSFALGAGVIVVALAAAGVLYFSLGAPGYPDLPIAERLATAQAEYDNRPHQDALEAKAGPYVPPADIDKTSLDLIVKLRAAVASRPDDLQGQTLLAGNEAKIGNYVGARKADEAVIRLKGSAVTAQDYSGLAELMIYAAGGLVTPEAEATLAEALKRDPKDSLARFYLGLMAAQVGRPDRTFAMWKPLLDEGPADAPWIAPIRARLQDVADAAGIAFTLPGAATSGPGPSASDMSNAAQMSPEDRQKMIEGMVAGLESRLMSQGGAIEDWTKLINALGVLKASDRAAAAYAKAKADFAGHPGELSALQAAAVQAGLAP